jgi:hypothetical protein
MASRAGSSSPAFFCVTSRMKMPKRTASSSARIDFWRPTNNGTTRCGNATTSRSSSTGTDRVSPGASNEHRFAVVMVLEPHPPERTAILSLDPGLDSCVATQANVETALPRSSPQAGSHRLFSASSASVSHLSAISIKNNRCAEVRASSANRTHTVAFLCS